MKLSISNIGWENENDAYVYGLMEKYGCSGLEIAPTRIFPENPYSKISEAAEWSRLLKKEHGFSISSMQSIWFGRQEKLFGTQKERDALADYTKQAIDFAAAIGCGNLVFGCPRNRNCPEGADLADAILFFREIGDYAASKGTMIGMEANPPIYNTNYINDTASALALVREVASKGFLLNLDVGTMIQNGEDMALLSGQVEYISHVHISEPGLKPIEKREIHRALKEVLLSGGYYKFISVEMGKTGDMEVIGSTLEYAQEIFGEKN